MNHRCNNFSTNILGLMVLVCLFLSGCNGGGGDSVPGVEPGPAAYNDPITPLNPSPVPASRFKNASEIQAQITGVDISSAPVVHFTVADQDGYAIEDLTSSNLSFAIAKLVAGTNGDSDHWQSYINTTEAAPDPADNIGTGTESQIQATRESGGTLVHEGTGSYSYTFKNDITSITSPVNVTYEPDLTHRVAIQFSGGPLANPIYTWQPSSGATSNIQSYDVVATESCNQCHGQLALHGGGRRETQYCVTCHNPGTTDANTGNTVDFKVMIHKIHRGAELPSVKDSGSYKIYGHNDRAHDYSKIELPMDIRNCTQCHAGSGSGTGDQVLTNEGDNWMIKPTMEACGSCHDDVDFTTHQDGYTDNSECASCHTPTGDDVSVKDAHKLVVQDTSQQFQFNIHSISQTAPGEFPQVVFSVTNPQASDSAYNILTDTAWTTGSARLSVDLAWDTDDYHNTGNGSEDSSVVSIDAIANAVDVGNGQFQVTSSVAIPNGDDAPNIAATGSGAVVIEGRASVDVGSVSEPNVQNIPVTNAVDYFSIDETDGEASPRREVVDLSKCLNCHVTLSLHGGNRTDNINSCVTCHNPRNTDREVRAVAVNPPTDGKTEEALHFKTMIHGIHAAAFREHPLQVVGYRGFSTYVYDSNTVHFPTDLDNCATCHEGSSYSLPLPDGVLGTTIDTGADHEDPSDDTVITPATATCSSCHDSAEAIAHMTINGASFNTTQAAIDSGSVQETCNVCHGTGRDSDVSTVHDIY